MPLFVTPGQFSRRADFYLQLRQLTGAGLGLVQALQQLQRTQPGRKNREALRKLIESIGQGFTFSESLQSLGTWLPAFDLALLHAGEQSGRLEACFGLLADYYQDRARMARQLLTDLAYPAFLFHFAIFIFPFAKFFADGNLLMYLVRTLGILIPIYAVLALMIYAAQSRHTEGWRAWVESVLRPVPLLGWGRHCLALSRLAAALEALISAGVTIVEAWELAATASGSPALRQTVHSWRPMLNAGQTPAEIVSTSSRFPELFANQYATGEISGKLDETLRRLHAYYQDEGSRKLRALAQWTPKIIYLLIAGMIGYRVISFYTDYFKMIQNIGGW